MFNKNEELISIIDPEDLLEHTQTQGLNDLITATVSAPYSKDLEDAFYIGSKDIDDHNIFWLYKVDERTRDNNILTVQATYSLFDDLKAYGVIRDRRPSKVNAAAALSIVLEGSRWQVGNVTTTRTGTANWYYVSRLEAFWELLENWNVEFKPRMTYSEGKITGRYIDITNQLSDDYGKWYEYGDSLISIVAEQNTTSLYTAFIGRGRGEEVGDGFGRRIGFDDLEWSVDNGDPVDKPAGQDYIEIPWATEEHGYSDGTPRTTVVIFEDTEEPEELIQQTYEHALSECRPKLQMKADVLETKLSELGETCAIIRDQIGVRYKTRVFKLTRNFLNKNQKTVEFGDEIVQSTAKRNTQTAKAIKKQEEQTIFWLDSIRNAIINDYFDNDGYNYDLKAGNDFDLPGGYYSFDRPLDQDPTKVIYMGAGQLLIANSKNPDGSWAWKTALTGDGVVADRIVGINSEFVSSSWNSIDSTVQIIAEGIFSESGNHHSHLHAGQLAFKHLARNMETKIDGNGIRGSKTGTSTDYERLLDFTDEGMRLQYIAGQGTQANTSLILEGAGQASFQYIDFNGGQTIGGVDRARIEHVGPNFRILHPNGGRITVTNRSREDDSGVVASNAFTTLSSRDDVLSMVHNRIQTPRNSTRDMYLAPNGQGKVRVANNNHEYYPIRAIDFENASSRRLKTDIEPYKGNALDVLNGLSVVEYYMKKDVAEGHYNRYIGLISEDSPEVASQDGESIMSYAVDAYLIKGVQELSQTVDYQNQQINALTEQLEKQQKQINALIEQVNDKE